MKELTKFLRYCNYTLIDMQALYFIHIRVYSLYTYNASVYTQDTEKVEKENSAVTEKAKDVEGTDQISRIIHSLACNYCTSYMYMYN